MKPGLDPMIVDKFIIEVSLIDPIEKIVRGLKSGEFRDCDIKYLDQRLEKYMTIAAEMLGIHGIQPSDVRPESYIILNEYTTKRYLEWFSALLSYFKQI